jgi:hypothetical protein
MVDRAKSDAIRAIVQGNRATAKSSFENGYNINTTEKWSPIMVWPKFSVKKGWVDL